MNNKTTTAYHGTNFANAKLILDSGMFKKGTWWALDINDAIYYGGPVIFCGQFKNSLFSHDMKNKESWQFHILMDIKIEELNGN